MRTRAIAIAQSNAEMNVTFVSIDDEGVKVRYNVGVRNRGHGSRGLSSTPLAAELIASQIMGESPPLSRELCRALSPARFLVRDLARNRI